MATILNIETSTAPCSVALSCDGGILCHREELEGRNHAVVLSDFIKESLDHLERHDMELDAVAVSLGPGSYTGLRIGLSEAKGLAYAKEVPLIGVETLKLLCVGAMFHPDVEMEPEAALVPMIDARRMEVYTAAYNLDLTQVMKPQPLILDGESYKELLEERPVYFFGDGSEKARDVISSPNAHFIRDIVPMAVDMLALAEQAYREKRFVDLAYVVPTYLKEFQATRPRRLF